MRFAALDPMPAMPAVHRELGLALPSFRLSTNQLFFDDPKACLSETKNQ